MLNIIKSNNPAAIRYNSANKWLGQIGNSKGFAIFENPIYGVRAGMVLLKNAYFGKGLQTLEKIFEKYAPFEDFNNPTSYANTVLKKWQKGAIKGTFKPNTIKTVIPSNPDNIYNLLYFITEVETGNEFEKYYNKNFVFYYSYMMFAYNASLSFINTDNELIVTMNGQRSQNLKLIPFSTAKKSHHIIIFVVIVLILLIYYIWQKLM